MSKRIALPAFDQLQNRFHHALNKFILDTKDSERIPGFIAFWPYIKFHDDLWKHNFDPNNPIFRHVDIKNDIGDSALAAICLMKTGHNADHVSNYAHILSYKEYENGFFAFLPRFKSQRWC